MKTAQEPKTITCHKCGSEVDFEESLGAEVGKPNLLEWTKQIGLSTDFPDKVIVTNSAVTVLGLVRGKNDGLLVLNDARPGCLKVAQIKGWHVR